MKVVEFVVAVAPSTVGNESAAQGLWQQLLVLLIQVVPCPHESLSFVLIAVDSHGVPHPRMVCPIHLGPGRKR